MTQRELKCGQVGCSRLIGVTEDQIICAMCNMHFHPVCVDLEAQMFVIKAAQDIPGFSWSCPKCFRCKGIEAQLTQVETKIEQVERKVQAAKPFDNNQLTQTVGEIVQRDNREMLEKIKAIVTPITSIKEKIEILFHNNQINSRNANAIVSLTSFNSDDNSTTVSSIAQNDLSVSDSTNTSSNGLMNTVASVSARQEPFVTITNSSLVYDNDNPTRQPVKTSEFIVGLECIKEYFSSIQSLRWLAAITVGNRIPRTPPSRGRGLGRGRRRGGRGRRRGQISRQLTTLKTAALSTPLAQSTPAVVVKQEPNS